MRTAAFQLASFGITIDSLERDRMGTGGLPAVGEDPIASLIEHISVGSLGEAEEIADVAVLSAGAL